jgi:hypothetical protein
MPQARRVMGAFCGAVVLALGPVATGTASAAPAAYEDCWAGYCTFEKTGLEGNGDKVSSVANY